MGSSISRVDDVYNCYESFCNKLNEKPKEDIDVQEHTKELIKKYKLNITKNNMWWYNAT